MFAKWLMVFVTDMARSFLHFLGFMTCVTCGIYVSRYITNHANEMEFGMETRFITYFRWNERHGRFNLETMCTYSY